MRVTVPSEAGNPHGSPATVVAASSSTVSCGRPQEKEACPARLVARGLIQRRRIVLPFQLWPELAIGGGTASSSPTQAVSSRMATGKPTSLSRSSRPLGRSFMCGATRRRTARSAPVSTTPMPRACSRSRPSKHRAGSSAACSAAQPAQGADSAKCSSIGPPDGQKMTSTSTSPPQALEQSPSLGASRTRGAGLDGTASLRPVHPGSAARRSVRGLIRTSCGSEKERTGSSTLRYAARCRRCDMLDAGEVFAHEAIT
jgi:hypothetical protein